MSYIAPNSTIRLYANIPLDNSYTNTLWFNSLAEQESYFHGTASVIATLSSQYYQRASKNTLKIQYPVGSCYQCNYLAFRNTSFENKWFYAFVTNVEYVNNEVTEITYELDYMQSFLKDVAIVSCFVEREHCLPSEDVEGNFILPEPVTVEDYLYDGYTKIYNASDVKFLALLNSASAPTINGKKIGNNFYGCDLFVASDPSAIAGILGDYDNDPESLLGVYSVPASAVPENGPLAVLNLAPHDLPFTLVNPYVFGSYSPRNRKLFTFPYSCIIVSDSSGVHKFFRREYFEGSPAFNIIENILPPVSVSVYPRNYRKASSGGMVGDTITLSGFPEGCWAINSGNVYAYRAQQNLPISLLTGVGSAGVSMAGTLATGALLGNPVSLATAGAVAGASVITNSVNAVINTMQQVQQARQMPDSLGGSTMSNSSAFASGTAGIYAGHAKIPEENARSIDHFFSLYGYQTNKVKVPNVTGRSQFNYVKVAGDMFEPLANGKVNAFDISRMNMIVNNGITFWHNFSAVGNYSNAVLDANRS